MQDLNLRPIGLQPTALPDWAKTGAYKLWTDTNICINVAMPGMHPTLTHEHRQPIHSTIEWLGHVQINTLKK